MNHVRVLIRHYSAWALWALAGVGALWEYVPQFRDSLPPWLVTALAVAGLIAKLIPQTPPNEDSRARRRRQW